MKFDKVVMVFVVNFDDILGVWLVLDLLIIGRLNKRVGVNNGKRYFVL